jgi:tetratricopeptide (TPR) repeat protein
VTPAPSARRERPVFWLLTLLLVLGGVELGARLIEQVENAAARRKNPYVEAVNPVPAFEVVTLGGREMVHRSGFHPLMRSDLDPFPLQRPVGGLRIFVLGGSAAAGWPYQLGDTNISALLDRKLRRLYPGRQVEVINMAAGTYGSHRVGLILEEVVRYNPDAIFLYNGNNEFLENLVFRPQAPPAPFHRSATARITYQIYTSLTAPKPRFDVKNYNLDNQVWNQLSFAFSRTSRYREDPRQFEALLDHYRFNVEAAASAASEARVPLFLVTCPVNLKDWRPNVSRHRPGLPADALARFTDAFRAGYLAVEQGDFAAALAPLRSAVAQDDEHAEAHFLLATALRRSGQPAEARAEYVRALERDAFPFRELPEFQAILREVAGRRGVPLVDIVPSLNAAAGDGIPGFDTFIDYVHLTEQAQERVAHELLLALRARGLLPGVTTDQVEATRLTVVHQFWARRDLFAVDVNYAMAMIMHQHDRLDALYAEAMATFERAAREDPSLATEVADRAGLMRRLQAVVVPYRELKRAEKLGLLRERYTPEQAQAIDGRYREMIYQGRGSTLSRQEFLEKFPAAPY